MRKLLLITLALGMAAPTFADIQAPPGSKYNATRKLGRGLSNIIYSVMEVPEQIARKSAVDGGKAGWSFGLVDGTSRMLNRVAYGFFEVVTFHTPTHRGTFKPPYKSCGKDNRIEMNPRDGLSEFPPELGSVSYYNHTRRQKW